MFEKARLQQHNALSDTPRALQYYPNAIPGLYFQQSTKKTFIDNRLFELNQSSISWMGYISPDSHRNSHRSNTRISNTIAYYFTLAYGGTGRERGPYETFPCRVVGVRSMSTGAVFAQAISLLGF